MAIKIQIVAEDKATPVINKALDNTKKKGGETAGNFKKGFADAFENLTQNATGAFGSVAGGLFKIPWAGGNCNGGHTCYRRSPLCFGKTISGSKCRNG